MKLPWQPHTQKPAVLPATALIAVRDDLDQWFVLGLYYMTNQTRGEWCDEESDEPLNRVEYMWLDEVVLTSTLPDQPGA